MLGSDTMANPLFYNKVIPLDSVAHRNFAVQNLDRPLDFAGAANLIPALTEEFVAAAPHLPIAFLPGATRPSAVFVVGTRPGSNVFIDADGKEILMRRGSPRGGGRACITPLPLSWHPLQA